MPRESEIAVSGNTVPVPAVRVKATRAESTGFPQASKACTVKSVGRRALTLSVWASPSRYDNAFATPAFAVSAKAVVTVVSALKTITETGTFTLPSVA